ncbi:hypothetical protein B0H66DRAFT_176210 [Apodospora peruviana]|uniref:Secreted protein n=1 Tax=Apodospora peruviana TaxID=516989 RepID=A0AAE0IAS5_9PEZI|nr:hypothetical protein B0H66DRAFT_176210 [Apodospora peruviana]
MNLSVALSPFAVILAVGPLGPHLTSPPTLSYYTPLKPLIKNWNKSLSISNLTASGLFSKPQASAFVLGRISMIRIKHFKHLSQQSSVSSGLFHQTMRNTKRDRRAGPAVSQRLQQPWRRS